MKQGRRLLWRFGSGDGLFEQLGYKTGTIDYKQLTRMPRHKDVDAKSVHKFADLIMQLGSKEDIGVAV